MTQIFLTEKDINTLSFLAYLYSNIDRIIYYYDWLIELQEKSIRIQLVTTPKSHWLMMKKMNVFSLTHELVSSRGGDQVQESSKCLCSPQTNDFPAQAFSEQMAEPLQGQVGKGDAY